LVVDVSAAVRATIAKTLKRAGFSVATAEGGADALEQLQAFEPDLILSDMRLPKMSALDLLREVRSLGSSAVVVILSSDSAVESAVDAMTAGAADYLTRPVKDEALLSAVKSALERRSLESIRRHLVLPIADRAGRGVLVGTSGQSQELLRAVTQVAPSEASVLLIGETGTGKDLVATTVHARSRHAQGPFIKLHCGALEDEPRDREAAAETSADPTSTLYERLEQAHGGSLFLDGVDEMSPAAQARLARALMERESRHEGAGRLIATDVRLISASRRELLDLVQAGSFREDLFYRLAVVTLRIAPLRMRPSDIPLLAMHFLRRFARQNDKRIGRIREDVLDLLTEHCWPGNVRELENALERAVVLATGETIEPRHLPPSLTRRQDPAGAPSIPGASLAEIERYAIIKTLEAQEGKVARAAKILGISPRTVQYKLRRYTQPDANRNASGAH